MSDRENFAAVDLGSNSFHMIIARLVDGSLHVMDRLKESVRLGGGLRPDGSLDEASQERALACLQRFGERIRTFPSENVRAVGTNTLRKAKHSRDFVLQAEQALGYPIETIPGTEEARLVYLGVAHTMADDTGRRLVVDIGGGSTECIIGERFEPLVADSLYMGCVSHSREFFANDELTKDAFRKAELAAQLEAQSIERRYCTLGWEHAIGSSGTINAIAEISRLQGWSDSTVTPSALKKIKKALLAAGKINKVALDGLQEDRRPVLAGGLAVLSGLFERLGIKEMRPADGALREGLLYDIIGRSDHEDVRDRTIRAMGERFAVDQAHAARVEKSAIELLKRIAKPWHLDFVRARQILSWAAHLHEIGLAVAYSGYHKHGAYLITHADTPGFSRDGKEILAAVIRGHRRKIPRAFFSQLDGGAELATRCCILLRLAVALNRSRSDEALPEIIIDAAGDTLTMEIFDGWLEDHPLTQADLQREAVYLKAVGITLRVTAK